MDGVPALPLRTGESVKASKKEIGLANTPKNPGFVINLGERQGHVTELVQV